MLFARPGFHSMTLSETHMRFHMISASGLNLESNIPADGQAHIGALNAGVDSRQGYRSYKQASSLASSKNNAELAAAISKLSIDGEQLRKMSFIRSVLFKGNRHPDMYSSETSK